MSRSPLRTLLALAALVALLGLGACGGEDDEGAAGGTPAQSDGGSAEKSVTDKLFAGTAADNRAEPGRRQEGRQAHGAQRRRRGLHGPRQDVLHVCDRDHQRGPPRALRLPARQERAAAGPRRGRPGDLRGRQDRHRPAQERDHVHAAREPRGQVGGRQVRDRARLLGCRRERICGRLLRRPGRSSGAGRRLQGDPRHRDAGRPDDRLQAQEGHRRGARRGARDADLGAGAEGVRGEVRQGDAVDLRRGPRRLHRPVHDRVRRRGQGHRLRRGSPHPHRPQPRLRAGGRLPAGVPGRDRHPGRQRRHRRRDASDPLGREHGVGGDRAAREPAQAAAGEQQDRALGRAGWRLAHDLDGQQPSAVRRHRRAQGRDRRASTASPCASSAAARRWVPSRST